MTSFASVNGVIAPLDEAAVPVTDPSFLHGLGLFETIGIEGGRPLFLQDHLERLAGSMKALGFPDLPWDPATELEKVISASGTDRGMIRMTVSPGRPGGRPALVVAPREPLPVPETVRVGISPYPVDPRAITAGHKCTSRLVYEMGRRFGRGRGWFEALVPTTDGDLGEGTISNYFAVVDGGLVTPPLSRGILPGVVRKRILEACRRDRVALDEAPLHPDDLRRADEILLTNSGIGVLAVDAFDGSTLQGPSGAYGARLTQMYRRETDRA